MTQNQNMLEDKIQEVGRRIQALREDMNLSAAELAEKIGLTEEEYLMYESGQKDFSFTFIYILQTVTGQRTGTASQPF